MAKTIFLPGAEDLQEHIDTVTESIEDLVLLANYTEDSGPVSSDGVVKIAAKLCCLRLCLQDMLEEVRQTDLENGKK